MLPAIRSLLRSRLSRRLPSLIPSVPPSMAFRTFSSGSGTGGNKDDSWHKNWNSSGSSLPDGGVDPPSIFDWGEASTWSTGLTKDHFDGEAVGRQIFPGESPVPKESSAMDEVVRMDEEDEILRMVEEDNKKDKAFVEGWKGRMIETCQLLKQVREPGVRGSYLKDSEKAEMYRLHKENPEVYDVERLAKDFRIMRQRVHAILWLKEMEEEEEKKLGRPLDDSVEILLDNFPEFFTSHDREFHVASLPYKPDFKVMPEDWDGTTRDPDEVHYEISVKEDQMLYEEFVQRLNFNKKKFSGDVKWHKYSRRRPAEGWSFIVEKMGSKGKRGAGGGWKFASLPDGSSRGLNEMEKMYVKRETPKRRRRIIAPFK
ncbi:hypothetical protein KSP39_PZI018812 [Platanthera zijinensis]|uniref:Ribosomal protein S35 n=1 Tax=Platanthera zijinensis TaxID=2320716 RepID=A0AAP0B446_9ASPA